MSHFISGRLVVVVGPSGAGKDSILNAAKTHFEQNTRVEFVRRIITRECDPATEIHDSVTEQQFIEQQGQGKFAVCWQANGLHYGLPAAIHHKIDQGQLLIANGSRAAIDDIRSKFDKLTVVHIIANVDALAKRLERRNRESREQIKNRLQRSLEAQVNFDCSQNLLPEDSM